MRGAVAGDHLGIVVVACIELREVAQGDHQRTDQERQQGQLAARGAMFGVEVDAQGFEVGDVDLLDIAEVRDAPLGFGHLLRNLSA
ncbi:hypothetical protein D3C71_1883920 [compost metagenome]